jgi:polyisoprenoid-binding protein YceI
MRILTLLTALLVASVGQAAEERFALDARHSDLVVHVRKKGLFSAFEHDHYLHPQRWHGTVTVDVDHPEEVRVELAVDAASLVDHQPKLSTANREKVEGQIRSPSVLDAQRFPEVRFVADRIEVHAAQPGATDGERELTGALLGSLDLHGHAQPITIAFHARIGRGGVVVRGHTEFDQSQFGISPLRKAGGAIAVQDHVTIDFDAMFTPVEAQ